MCGQKYYYNKCFYIQPSRAPPTFVFNKFLKNEIQEKLKTDEEFKKKVETSIQRVKDFAKNNKNKPNNKNKDKDNKQENLQNKENLVLIVHHAAFLA